MASENSVINSISKSPKYSGLYLKTIERIVNEMAENVSDKKLEKASRKKLHQIWGAYVSKINYKKLYSNFIEELSLNSRESSRKESLMKIMQSHSSTSERLPILESFYSQIFEIIGNCSSIVDYGCGLNPLTYYWMPNVDKKPLKYTGLDLDLNMIDFCNQINKALKLTNFVESKPFDVFVDTPINSDVSFLFKLLPLLERQKKGGAEAFVKSINSKFQVWSFPALSLGGIAKNMEESYSIFALDLIETLGLKYEKLIFDTEIVYVVKK